MGHGMNAAVGYYAYHLFGWDIARGQEVYATLSRQQLLNPSFQVVYSWEYGEGWYAELGISEAVPIWKQKLNLSSKLGFNIHYFRETTWFSHVELKAEMPYKVKKITIYPSVNFSLGLAKEFNNTFYIGLGIGLQRTVIN
jgi:hypothetical protein